MNLPPLRLPLALLTGIIALPLWAAAQSLPPVEHLSANTELPDPFAFPDGTKCRTRADWSRRREQIKELILGYEYGHPAPDPKNVVGQVTATTTVDAGATERQVTLTMGPGSKITTNVIITTPSGTGPFPIIIKGDLCWKRVAPEIIATIIKRGYALAEFDRTMIAPDDATRDKGVLAAYPDADEGDLAAWAWGFSRVIDYLITQEYVDKAKLIVTGHSRGGKAALLAGALDERVAVTVPNGSGAGGAGCFRLQPDKTEDLEKIVNRFPYWFGPHFSQFIGHVDQLPFDQHFVRALVAPRALLNTDAFGDVWANGPGTQETYLAAWEVFKFLGAPEKIGIHWREGKHEQNLEDFTALLDFSDMILMGKPAPEDFNKLPFPQQPKIFGWKTPAIADYVPKPRK